MNKRNYDQQKKIKHLGIFAALGAALLFGSGTPLAKLLLTGINPWLLAGLLYLGSGIGSFLYRQVLRMPKVRLKPGEWRWLVLAIFTGGMIGPVLLMFGLTAMPASGASLLLNAEFVFTIFLAWFAFRENFNHRSVLGIILILAGAIVVSWTGKGKFGQIWPAMSVLGACLAWGIDNNLTRLVSLTDAAWLASIKGFSAGTVNLILAFSIGANFPSLANLAGALAVGWITYGLSLVLYIIGLRHLGTARTSAYFSIAPFFGTILAIPLLNEVFHYRLLIAGVLMAGGIWLHLTERHIHCHTHEALQHEHEHNHDEHHQHQHDEPLPGEVKHSHLHQHYPVTHTHPHYPDMHHRHNH